uniref:Uncharacterized protein n=1 Tax=Neolamprologus brichardi TaxID=32507 RepID=A0A3Q4GXK5_NEOBR
MFTQPASCSALKLGNKCTHTSVKKPVKFGGGRLMVWWMFSAANSLPRLSSNKETKLLLPLFPFFFLIFKLCGPTVKKTNQSKFQACLLLNLLTKKE